jgi:hypothetical protein
MVSFANRYFYWALLGLVVSVAILVMSLQGGGPSLRSKNIVTTLTTWISAATTIVTLLTVLIVALTRARDAVLGLFGKSPQPSQPQPPQPPQPRDRQTYHADDALRVGELVTEVEVDRRDNRYEIVRTLVFEGYDENNREQFSELEEFRRRR